ncbi:MAG TPA: hypothetical protein PLD37_00650 [Usitatibacteraceae bacterium]|nr:hypothetical protein [Usitatibacteraceae bacterium]
MANEVGTAAFMIGLFLFVFIPLKREHAAASGASILLCLAGAALIEGIAWGAGALLAVSVALGGFYIRNLVRRRRSVSDI